MAKYRVLYNPKSNNGQGETVLGVSEYSVTVD